jgi:hypothetical protein
MPILQGSQIEMSDEPGATPQEPIAAKALTPAAQRALDEAQARRAEIDARAAALSKTREINGRGGLEPGRYNDWEVKGLTSDF